MNDNNINLENADKDLIPIKNEINKPNDEEEKILEGDNDQEGIIVLNDKLRKSLFYLLCVEYCISSADGGIIPQQNQHIKEDFGGDEEFKVGLFGSIDYIGRILGALVMSLLINRINRKFFFSGCCIAKALTLIVPFFTSGYLWNLISRFLSGIPQTLLTSYGTIWVDQFAKHKHRTIMLPLFQLFALLGIIIGYGMGYASDSILSENYKRYSWRLSFGIEGIILGILGIIFLFYPNLYFSSTFYLNEDDDYKGKEKSIFQIAEERNKTKGENSLLKQLPKILCIKIFLFMSIGNTVAFFGMRVIQFYADPFMEKVLKVDKKMKFIYFILLCLTGPILGILICGIICSKIGGYSSRNGMKFILLLNFLASISSSLITVTLNQFLSLSMAWIFLFCYAACTPLQGGIIIACLPKELKGNGYAVNMFLLNCIGSFPSSYIYSLILDAFKNYTEQEKYRHALTITMFYSYFGLIMIVIASVFRFKLKGELDGSDNKQIEAEKQLNATVKNNVVNVTEIKQNIENLNSEVQNVSTVITDIPTDYVKTVIFEAYKREVLRNYAQNQDVIDLENRIKQVTDNLDTRVTALEGGN